MNRSIKQRVIEIVADQLGFAEDEIKGDSAFIEDLGADSLDIVELIIAMEEEFDTEIPDEDAERIVRVQDAIDYVEKWKKGRSRAS